MEPDTKVLGIDPSITGTGLVVVNAAGAVVHNQAAGSIPEPGLTLMARYRIVVDAVAAAVTKHKPSLVVMEGPALGMNNQGTFDLWGLLAVIRWELRHSLPFDSLILPTPPELRKWSTGKGNTPKEQMRLLVYKKWGVELPTVDEIEAFTFGLWGLAYLRGAVHLSVKKKKKRNLKAKS